MGGMSTGAKLLTLLRSGGGDPSASFTVTTTGAQTGSFQALTVSAPTRVDWGDGTPIDIYTGSGYRSHAYTSAGVWTVKILDPLNVTELYLHSNGYWSDVQGGQVSKLINLTSLYLNSLPNLPWVVGASAPMPTGLTYLYLNSLPNVTWVVGASAPMPTGLTTLYLDNLPNVTWVVGASAPMPAGLTTLYLNSMPNVTWVVGASAPMPTGLKTLNLYNLPNVTWVVGASAPVPTGLTTLYLNILPGLDYVSTLSACKTLNGMVNLQNNTFSQTEVDAIILDLYEAAKTRTSSSAWSLNLSGGTNAAPSGTYAAMCPPTTGKSAAYEIINDSCGVIAAGKEMSSVTVTGGLP